MYYRLDESDLVLQKAVALGNGLEVLINLEDPENRFTLVRGGDSLSCPSLGRLVAELGPDEQQGVKERMYRAVKAMFEDIEQKFPDSSTGILPFLNGHVYRIPTHDGFYAFELSYLPLPLDEPFPVVFPTRENEPHGIHHPDAPWPLTMRVAERIGNRQQEMIAMFDPYQLIDMFRCNALGREHARDFDATTGKRAYVFKPTRRYNRILIAGPDGTIKKSYDLVQQNILKTLHDFLQDITRRKDEAKSTAMAGHVLSCLWHRIHGHEAAGPELHRLSGARLSFDPAWFGISNEPPVNGLDFGLGKGRG